MPSAAIRGSMSRLSILTPKSVSRMLICLARLMSRLEKAMRAWWLAIAAAEMVL